MRKVLNSDYASMLALEFQKNPIVDEEAAFDIFPPYAPFFEHHIYHYERELP